MRLPRAFALLLPFAAAACYASNVVAPAQRLVVADPADLPFHPAPSAVLDGLYESIDVRGDAAQSLRKVYYLFTPDGAYTGAALTESGGEFRFQTLAGKWRVGPDGLALDDQPPARLEAAPDHLRISAPNGVLVLRRGSL